ncbi:MAG: hypothetical protein Kow00124_12900 [Anaerolineae bacterium]
MSTSELPDQSSDRRPQAEPPPEDDRLLREEQKRLDAAVRKHLSASEEPAAHPPGGPAGAESAAASAEPPGDMAMALTGRLDDQSRMDILGSLLSLSFGTSRGSASSYLRLPRSLADAKLEGQPRWLIELHGLTPGSPPLGLEIVGDVVLGRGLRSNPPPDLDLDEYNGLEKGVSRRHALLRPTPNHLFLIDLNSTNGTMHNAIPIGPGVARALHNNDAISLGDLGFTVKIIEGPRPAPPPRESDEDQPEEKTKPLTD